VGKAGRAILGAMEKLVAGARRAGPYVLVELLLPGGSLIALGMLAWANRKALAERFRNRTVARGSRPG
jgi:hypothetical protein